MIQRIFSVLLLLFLSFPSGEGIRSQVINHQHYRKYFTRQKCENTFTPHVNGIGGFYHLSDTQEATK